MEEKVSLHGAGNTFAEPERSRVVFLRVVHWLQTGWAYTFDVPQVKKFMCAHGIEPLRIAFQKRSSDVNRRAVCMLHTPVGGLSRKMVDEHIRCIGSIVHPLNTRAHNGS